MKKIGMILAACIWLTACGPNTGQEGTVNDGMKEPGDGNGALKDSSGFQPNPSTDTTMGDHRVDTEQRDSSKQ